MPVGFLGYFILTLLKTSFIFNYLFLATVILTIIFLKFVYRLAEKGEIKDGSFSLIFISVYSLIYFLIRLFADIKNFSFLDPENLILFLLIFSSLILLVNLEIMDKFLDK